MTTPAHYDKPVTSEKIDPYEVMIGGVKADPYRIARAYGIDDAALGQALKKLLRCGRKHKSIRHDIREVITTLERWEQMEAEDAEFERLKEGIIDL